MNTLPHVVRFAPDGASLLPTLRVRTNFIVKGLTVLVAAGILLGSTAKLRAQSEDSGFASQLSDETLSAEADATAKPGFTISNVQFSLPGEHTTGAGYVTTVAQGGYSGTIDYTCALSVPTKAAAPPECIMYPGSAAITANGKVKPQILIFGKGTKLPKGVASNEPAPWVGVGFGAGGVTLALGLMFGIPARRRAFRMILPAFVLLVAMGSMTACVDTPKIITAGQYTFKVTGTDSTNKAIKASGLVYIRVL